MADLVSIEGKTRPAKLQGDVVAILERALGEAKEGKIVSVALAILCSDGDVEVIASPTDHFYKMVGALGQLQFDMMTGHRQS